MSVTTTKHAVSEAISDGDSVYLAGFTHLIPFATGHEIIRQGIRNLHLIRATPDLIYDQMIAAGCARKLTFSWAGNPGLGVLSGFRRAVEDGIPNEIELDEYTHFGLVSRLNAGASNLPFMPVWTFTGSDLPDHNDDIRTVTSPYEGEEIPVVPPLEPDVSVVRAQRCDHDGNTQLWGISGEIEEAALASDVVIVSVEEIVDEKVIRSDPNRTVLTSAEVDYVVKEPFGAHPSYAQGYYDRDNQAYHDYAAASRTEESLEEWIDEWIRGVESRAEYVEKLGAGRIVSLQAKTNQSTAVDMGSY